MAVIRPFDKVGRFAVLAVDFENLRVAIGLTDVVTLDDEAVSNVSLHGTASSGDQQVACPPFLIAPDRGDPA